MSHKKPAAHIAVSATSFAKNPQLRKELQEAFPKTNIAYPEPGIELSGQRLADFLEGAEVALVGKEPITSDLLRQLPALRVIGKYGVGVDNIDFAACDAANVQVAWQAGANARFVAEHTLGLILSLSRNITSAHAGLSRGRWIKNGGRSLYGKVVSIVGCGNVGTALLGLLQPFQCQLQIVDIEDRSEQARRFDAVQVSLEEAGHNSNVLTLHTPLTDLTRGMITAKFLQKMPADSLLINTARGKIVDLPALKDFLKDNGSFSCALDVFPDEPLQDPELARMSNVLLTPHIAANSVESVLAMGRASISSLLENLTK